MSETCFYHPQARASASCPGCQQQVCDRCRAAGDFTSCGQCVELGPGGGVTPELLAAAQARQATAGAGGAYAEDQGHAAYGAADMSGGYGDPGGWDHGAEASGDFGPPPTCTTHPELLAEMQCLNCFRPFCLTCCPTGYCTDCAPQMGNRVQQQLNYQPSGEGNLHDIGASYEGFDDLAAGYDEIPEATAAPARPRKPRPQGAGGKKGANKGKAQGKAPAGKGGKKAPAKRGKGGGPNWGLIAGGLLGLALLGGGGYGAYTFLNQPKAPAAPIQARIDFVKPAERAAISGVATVQVKVGSPEQVKQVELTIDGRYWNKWKAPLSGPVLSTEWPTALPQFKKGPHKLEATVEYQAGESAKAKRDVTTR